LKPNKANLFLERQSAILHRKKS